MLAHVGHAAGHAEALPQGPRGHVDEAEPGGGVALEVRAEGAELEELRGGKQAGLGPGGVQDGGGVALGQDEAVVVDAPRVGNFVLHHLVGKLARLKI